MTQQGRRGELVRHIGLALPPAVLTAADETRLATAIEAGLLATEARQVGSVDAGVLELIMLEWIGRRAAHRFVECNLRLVAMVSHREAARSGLPESDLFQEGCLGLMEAVHRFDHRRNLRFATYALYWIRAYIGAVTANRAGELNLPVGRAEDARGVRGEQAMLSQELGREATAEDVAGRLGRKRDEVAALLDVMRGRRQELGDGQEQDPPDEQVAADFDRILRWRIPGRELLLGLSDVRRRIIAWRYGFVDGEEHSISDIARRLDLPRSTVRRDELAALDQLRASCPQQAIAHLR